MKYIKATFTITDINGKAINNIIMLQTAKDLLCEITGRAGFESFEDENNIVYGYIQKELFDKDLLDNNIQFIPLNNIKISYILQDIKDKNWNEAWEETGFEPIIIKNKCIIHDTIHAGAPNLNNILDIIIDTKQAFGTGNHETTFMIANRLFDIDIYGKSILDCGCGTGILSIISSKLGAKQVTGYDIDEWSVENTKHNCTLNNEKNIKVLHGDADIISSLDSKYDIVLANINRNILLHDMPKFKLAMVPNATLILSGFYMQDEDLLINKAKELNIKETRRYTKNNWCMLEFINAEN